MPSVGPLVDVTRALEEYGFYVADTFLDNEADLQDYVLSCARAIGKILPGRLGQLVERVVPRTKESAHAASLSAIYGAAALPFHMDSAHHLLPARTLILACANPGTVPVPTRLMDTNMLRFSSQELALLKSAVFLVRTGRRSFYSSIASARRTFLRIDPGCLHPTDARGEAALQVLENAIMRATEIEISWNVGRILIADNWRVLHARGEAARSRDRILLRGCVT